jgi:hypothetical protein
MSNKGETELAQSNQETNLAADVRVIESDSNSAYLLQEANLMNERVKWYLEQQEKLETQGLFASGAVWAFILSRPFTTPSQYVTWLPVILTSVLFVKSLLFTEALKESFSYIEKLEALSDVPEDMGWARTFRQYGRRLKRRWRKAFWITLVLGNLAAALVVELRHLLTPVAP